MRYPIGIQTFEKLRQEGFVYIDKTDLVYNLTHNGQYVFLSRPRRFGKSLLLSTIEAYYEGKKDLFKGLAIEKLETEWDTRPVIHLDLTSGLYTDLNKLRSHIHFLLSEKEKHYGLENESLELSERLMLLIQHAYQQTGRKVVILVDEYDKPLLEAVGKVDLQESFRAELRSLYSVLKSADRYIQFAMLTGVTKFGKLSVFSGLNNISDVSFNSKYATICGITESELLATFRNSIDLLAQRYKCSHVDMVNKLRDRYDGYRFSSSEALVYNPFSILNTFEQENLGSYWFSSGTPKYLVELIKMNEYDVTQLDGTVADEQRLSNIDTDNSDPIPAIYQSGYLTIKSYEREYDEYTLGFPNTEVRCGFMEYLIPFYTQSDKNTSRFDISLFRKEIREGNAQAFMERIKSTTTNMSYHILANCENDFQNLMYILFMLVSTHPEVEYCTSNGRIDMVAYTDKYVYIMEFKIDGTAQEAIDQINSKGYAIPWNTDSHKVIKIGANFSTSERRLTDYIIQD